MLGCVRPLSPPNVAVHGLTGDRHGGLVHFGGHRARRNYWPVAVGYARLLPGVGLLKVSRGALVVALGAVNQRGLRTRYRLHHAHKEWPSEFVGPGDIVSAEVGEPVGGLVRYSRASQ